MENYMPLDAEQPAGRLNPLNDYLFFKVMGEKGDEQQLLGFLNAVLGRNGEDRLVSVEILENKTFTAEVIGNKSCILDIRAVLGDGTRVNVEVQVRNQGNMDRRSLFYWSQEYIGRLQAGQDYRELPNVVAVNIVNFELRPSGGFHSTFHLWEDTDKDYMLTDALEIHFVDMVKYRRLREKDIEHEPLHRWLSWFNEESPAGLVEEVIKMDEAIQRAAERAIDVFQDEGELHAYHLRQMALSDWTSGINHAKREGKLEGKTETARQMKADNMPMSQIMKYTGLTEQQITEL
jgi:predicted transposase/invertase (TIGR01784 family)